LASSASPGSGAGREHGDRYRVAITGSAQVAQQLEGAWITTRLDPVGVSVRSALGLEVPPGFTAGTARAFSSPEKSSHRPKIVRNTSGHDGLTHETVFTMSPPATLRPGRSLRPPGESVLNPGSAGSPGVGDPGLPSPQCACMPFRMFRLRIFSRPASVHPASGHDRLPGCPGGASCQRRVTRVRPAARLRCFDAPGWADPPSLFPKREPGIPLGWRTQTFPLRRPVSPPAGKVLWSPGEQRLGVPRSRSRWGPSGADVVLAARAGPPAWTRGPVQESKEPWPGGARVGDPTSPTPRASWTCGAAVDGSAATGRADQQRRGLR